MVNEDSWDMTIKEIDEKFNNDEYWEKLYNKCTEGKNHSYKSVQDLKEMMLEWMYTHCLDSVMDGLKREYKHRKSKGRI